MKHSGFTLVEMVITVAVLAILTAIAIPNYQRFVIESRMTAQANELITALHLARSEAVKRNAPVSVSAKDGDWASGWEVVDAGGNVLRDFGALKDGSSLDSDADTITFQSNGQAGVVALELRPSDTGLSPGRNVSVDLAGRPSVCKPGYCN